MFTDIWTMVIVYVWSQYYRHQNVSFLFGLRFKAIYLPWVLCLFDFLSNKSIIDSMIGILLGHLYYFLEVIYPTARGGLKLLKTPSWM